MRNTIVVADGSGRRPSFFGFDIMITPLLIKVWFVLGLAACLVGGAWLCWQACAGALPEPFRAFGIYAGLGVAVIGPIVIRIHCEMLIVLFKIMEYLRR